MTIKKTLARIAIAAVSIAMAYLLYRALSRYSIDAIIEALRSISVWRVSAALAYAAGSYLCLTGFDYLGVRYAGGHLSYKRCALTSFVSLSIGHNIGFASLSSGAIRSRYYSRWGLGLGQVAKIVLFSGMTVALGLASLGGLGLLSYPADAQRLLGASGRSTTIIGLACIAFPSVYLLVALLGPSKITFRRWTMKVPDIGMAAAQTALGTLNYICVAACLHQLISAFSQVAFFKVAVIYVMANLAVLVSHVPGGLGVLEGSVLYLLQEQETIGAVVAFRLVYFFVPVSIGAPLFLISEYVLRSGRDKKARMSGRAAE